MTKISVKYIDLVILRCPRRLTSLEKLRRIDFLTVKRPAHLTLQSDDIRSGHKLGHTELTDE